MSDSSETIRKVTFVAFALVLVVCVAMSFQYRDQILGGFALRGAQSSFEQRVKRVVGPDAQVSYGESSDRSAQLVVGVPAAACPDDGAVTAILDAVWIAYAEEFTSGGMPIDSVCVTADVSQGPAGAALPRIDDTATLVQRTGVPAPTLHAMYAEKGYFDASREAVPAPERSPTEQE